MLRDQGAGTRSAIMILIGESTIIFLFGDMKICHTWYHIVLDVVICQCHHRVYILIKKTLRIKKFYD